MIDILSLQKDSQIQLFDTDTLIDSGVYPLDFRGMKTTDNTLNYNDVVSTTQYKYALARMTEINITEMETHNSRLYEGTVRATLELVLE